MEPTDTDSGPESEEPPSRIPAAPAVRLVSRFLFILTLVLAGSAFAAGGEGSLPAGAESERSRAGIVLVFLALLAVSGMVSGSETAIFSLNNLDLMQLKQKKGRSIRALVYLMEHPNDTLTTVLVLNNFVNVALSLAAGAMTETLLSGVSAGSIALAALGATTLILVFGEVLPKSVAHARAVPISRIVAWPTFAVARAFTPIRILINQLIHVIFRPLGVSEPKATEWISEEELKAVMSARAVSSILEEEERDMIDGVFDLRYTFAEEIMVPRIEVIAFADTLGQEEMLAELRRVSRSRVIIYKENLDHPVGFLLVKEVLLQPERDWRESMREALCLPVRVKLLDLLRRFRTEGVKIAVLVDEYGGVSGIVTLHDLLEEIVGDIAERHETVHDEITRTREGEWRVLGRANLEELGEEIGVQFPDDMGTTVAGFVMNTLGHLPKVGAELIHEGFEMRVSRVMGRRIMQIRIRRCEPAGAVPTGSEGAGGGPAGGSS